VRVRDAAELFGLAAGAAGATFARRAVRGPRRPGWTLRTELAQGVLRRVLMRSKTRGSAWLREVQASLPQTVSLASEVAFEPVSLAGLPAESCAPRAGHPERTLLYLHGGGYVIGSAAGYRDLAARLAVGANARVVAVDYRLAPEHRFPAQQDDCLAATRARCASRRRTEYPCSRPSEHPLGRRTDPPAASLFWELLAVSY